MSDRADRLLAALEGHEAGVMLVTSLVNVRWLTGFTGSNGLAIVGPETRVFLTDFRYEEQSAAEVDPSFERRIARGELLRDVPGLLPGGELALGFEDGAMSVRAHDGLREALEQRIALVAAGDPVEALRAVKEPAELEAIRAASELADAALREVMEQGLAGRTEREVALAIEDGMRRRGAQGASFDTIVAAGAHGALPHATPREVAIPAGTLVVVDWGGMLDGYCSDSTRTLATGEIAEEDRRIYDLVHAAQLAGLAAIAPGVGGREADGAARRVIEEAGHGEHFGHSLGHGVGLEVHEKPSLSWRSHDVLAAGNVVSCEPGVYVPGRVGVRIEDLCIVTPSGPEILNAIPKELVDVG